MTEVFPEAIEDANRWVRSLIELRKAYGLTQRDVAARMGERVSQGDVSRLERGADYRASTLIRYARAIGVELGLTVTPLPDEEESP